MWRLCQYSNQTTIRNGRRPKVTVDVATSTVVVDKGAEVTRVLLLEKLAKWGYPEVGTTNLVQKAKSYVSCAIGRLDK